MGQGDKLVAVTIQLKPLTHPTAPQRPPEQRPVGLATRTDIGFIGCFGQANYEIDFVLSQELERHGPPRILCLRTPGRLTGRSPPRDRVSSRIAAIVCVPAGRNALFAQVVPEQG